MGSFQGLRKRLNKFFMSFVSELVFTSEPEYDVLEWLVDRIAYKGRGARQFSMFNCEDVLDPDPVLRSFLLKLLLKCRHSDNVRNHLNDIIRSWRVEDVQSQIQTLLLVMDCHRVRYYKVSAIIILYVSLKRLRLLLKGVGGAPLIINYRSSTNTVKQQLDAFNYYV